MYRKGYFMSHEEERAAKGALIMEFLEAKNRLGSLRHAADKVAGELEGIAKSLRDKPETLTFNSNVLEKHNAEIGRILADIQTTDKELRLLGTRVHQAGISHLIPKD
jgi:chromosome segregation ATPase